MLAEMLDLVKNVAEIAKITNYRGWSLASDEVCLEKTYGLVMARPQNFLINFPAIVSHDYSVISLALNNIFGLNI